MYVVQVLSGLLPVRESDLRPADATEDAQLASKVPLLSLDTVRCRYYPELRPVDHRRVVLRPCCLRHRCFHLQVHRVQRVGISLHERLKFEYCILIEQLNYRNHSESLNLYQTVACHFCHSSFCHNIPLYDSVSSALTPPWGRYRTELIASK